MIGSLPTRTLPPFVTQTPGLRSLLALGLLGASRVLSRLARQLRKAESHRGNAPGDQVFEFYAEAGAPEGALYVDGKLIGYLPGVKRL